MSASTIYFEIMTNLLSLQLDTVTRREKHFYEIRYSILNKMYTFRLFIIIKETLQSFRTIQMDWGVVTIIFV